MRGPAIIALALATGCEARLGRHQAPAGTPAHHEGATGDGPAPDAPLGAFGAPQKITIAADDTAREDDGTLSHDGLELVFAVQNPDDGNRKDLFYASRPDLASPFGPASKLPLSGTGTSEETPRFSDDDLTLYFAKTVANNGLDIHRVTRPSAGAPNFGTPAIVQGVNSTGVDKWFMPCDGDRYLLIIGADIAEGVLGQGAPTIDDDLSSADGETGPFVTRDCLTVHFASTRLGPNKIFTSKRAAIGQPWSPPVEVDTFAALGGAQQDPFISDDTRIFMFVSDVDGTNDLYISTR